MSLKEFIRAHLSDNTDKLLLNAARYPEINIPFAVDQILARRQVKDKLPQWYANDELVYPSRISTEQCSSEITATYKQTLVTGSCVCDLTGGLGVDSFYFSQKAGEVIYVERFPNYCKAAENNFKALKANNIKILNEDTRQIAESIHTGTFYIDPARRADGNKRVFALTDCEPDVLQLKPLLLGNSQRLIVKISPMADIDETLRLLPETVEIHILSVRNECKELLFVLEEIPFKNRKEVSIHTINYEAGGNVQQFLFKPTEEKEAVLQTAGSIKKYLYEPNVSVLKSGAFKLTAIRFGLEKLHRHSHLYTSNEECPAFPGRKFTTGEVFEFSGKLLKQLRKTIPQANITTRNFNLSVEELRKRTGIKEGGDIYLLATTTANDRQILIACRKGK